MFPFLPLRDRLAQYRAYGVDAPYLPRAALALGWSAVGAPLRLYEHLRHGRALAATVPDPEPLFVMGVARSGTTHLHNLLAQDPRFGCVTNFQVMTQGFALSASTWLRPLLGRLLGNASRPTDNVALELDGPQEEDIALAACSRRSMLHCVSFPRAFDEHERRFMLLEDTPEDVAAWERAYLGVLRTATRACGGKPLVLKSPTNTGRLPTLRRLFPGARFVHIHRDPYDVFRSVIGAYRAVLPREQLQRFDEAALEDAFVASYARTLPRFLEQCRDLPAGHFAELAFADLERQPLEELERLYTVLELPGWEAARPEMAAYLERLGRYTKNPPEVPDRIVRRVNRDWAFALDALGYPRREPGASA